MPLSARLREREAFYTAIACCLHPRLGAASLLGSLPASLLPLVVPAWEYPAIPTLHAAEPVDRRIPEIERVYSSGGDPSRFRFALRFDAYTLAEGAVPREGFVQYIGPPGALVIVCFSHFLTHRGRPAEHVLIELFRSESIRRVLSARVFDRAELAADGLVMAAWP